jgi:calcineurin-like phosphoesterase family protein
VTIFYTADPHYGHNSIIKLAGRPFETTEDMDAELIRRHNEVVGADDTVYVLGDFTFKGKTRCEEYLSQLNGHKHLILGNHDPESTRIQPAWASVRSYAEITDGEDKVMLFHYPMREWNGCYRGTFHLYGHVHGGAPPAGRSLDVGVDCWDFRPVTMEQIKARLAEVGTLDTLVPHHGRTIEKAA